MLWENYICAERIKRNAYTSFSVNNYFWRTYDQQKIYLVEEKNDAIEAYEFKQQEEKVKILTAMAKVYLAAAFTTIHQKNYLGFIM